LSAIELLPNQIHVNKYFFWQLIPDDPDDEKFVDCAIACGADYIVTNDRHFRKLKKNPFPKVNVVNEAEFKHIFEAHLGQEQGA
jgi:predicted nucleic acid-binding protein